MDPKAPTEDEHDTEPATPMCGKKKRAAGHVLHCDKELGHPGRCSFDEDYEP